MVLPLFFLTMVTMISFMDLYKLQTEHLSKLCQNAKDAGMYAYAVSGGTEEITLPDVYSYKPVAGIIPRPAKWNYNSVKSMCGQEPAGRRPVIQTKARRKWSM